MENIRSQLKAVRNSKSIHELLTAITWDMAEFGAFLPLLLFTVTPLYQLVSDLLTGRYMDEYGGYSYAATLGTVSAIIWMLGILVVLIYIGKNHLQKTGMQKMLTQVKPMMFFIPFILLMLISTAINGITNYVLMGDGYREESLFTYIMYFAVYFACGVCIRRKKYKELLIYLFISISVILAIASLLHVWVGPWQIFEGKDGLSSVFHQFNHYGYFLNMSVLLSGVLLVSDKRTPARILCAVSFVLNSVTLIINNTFGCYLACFIGLIFCCIVICICDKKVSIKAFLPLVMFICISLVMSIWYDSIGKNIITFLMDLGLIAKNADAAKTAGTGRWDLWINTIKYIKEKPLFGFGVEGIAERLYIDSNNLNDRTHNEFLQYTAFFGIPAAVMYVCGVFSVFLNGLKNKLILDIYSQAALVCAFGYLVSSVFGNTMYYTAPFLFIFLGIGFVRK